MDRQVLVQRKNLVQTCRLTVKSLIDKASLASIDDDCEELINFCAVMEQLLSHRLKAQKSWFSIEEEQHNFWSFIRVACSKVPNSCIKSIANLENVKSPIAKGRAWLRCVLMEKRLSEYISCAFKQTSVTKKFYRDGAIFTSDDMNMLCGVLLGLNSIDFSFCLKGNNVSLIGPKEIDYTPYLKFHQSQESLCSDQEELNELNTPTLSSMTSSIMSEETTTSLDPEESWKQKYKALELKYKSTNEQKGYLEELGRGKEQQLCEIQRQRQELWKLLKQNDTDRKQERYQMENIVIELQKQLATVKQKHETLQQKHSTLMSQIRGGHVDMDSVTMIAPPTVPSTSQTGRGGIRVNHSRKSRNAESVSADRVVNPESMTNDQLSAEHVGRQKEDSQSLIAMAGSFSSQASVPSNENLTHNLTSTQTGRLVHNLDTTNIGESTVVIDYQDAVEALPDESHVESLSGAEGSEVSIQQSGLQPISDNSSMAQEAEDNVHIPKGEINSGETTSSEQDKPQEEEYVLVPDKTQQQSAPMIHVTHVDVDQSQESIESDFTNGNAGNESADLTDQNLDIINQNMNTDNQLDSSTQEESAEVTQGEGHAEDENLSDDIIVLSDVSITGSSSSENDGDEKQTEEQKEL